MIFWSNIWDYERIIDQRSQIKTHKGLDLSKPLFFTKIQKKQLKI